MSNDKRLITLKSWIAKHYAVNPPHINTVRRWAKEGRITPKPNRHGNSYYVHPDATYAAKGCP